MATILFINDGLKDKYAKLYLRKIGHEIIDYYIQSKEIDYIVLPLRGIEKDELFECLVKENVDKKYIVYNINNYMMELKNKYKLTFVELKKDTLFTYSNAIIKSEEIIKYAIEVLPITLKESKVLIIGYDNSARELVNNFLYFSNKVLLALNKEELEMNLEKNKITTINIEQLKDHIEGYDLIINTIPSLIIDKELLRYISPISYIFDVSESPFGVDFIKAKEYGLRAYYLSELPLKYAPKTYGIEYGKAIERGMEI